MSMVTLWSFILTWVMKFLGWYLYHIIFANAEVTLQCTMKGLLWSFIQWCTDTYTDSDKNLQHLGDERVWGLRSHGPVSGVERQGGLFMESSSGELLLYNRLTRQLKNLGVFSCARRPSIQRMQVIIYKESLVSLNGRHEDEDGIIRPHTHSYPWLIF